MATVEDLAVAVVAEQGVRVAMGTAEDLAVADVLGVRAATAIAEDLAVAGQLGTVLLQAV
ncbi:hypothetical protein AAC03nite_06380 [Alicyclobacillus acidoterrestris]|nr:hypothetical protein AAC03nite_06380 [Alicyclobacillus acidoterrestris]